nr:ABC transporter permease [Rhodococcus qingshengii]
MLLMILRRAGVGILMVAVVATVSFFLTFSGASDAARAVVGQDATQEVVDAKAHELGLDRPVLAQYADWVSHALTGNLGTSFFDSTSVTEKILQWLPVTLSIVVIAMLIIGVFSAVLGVVAAVRRGWLDRAIQFVSIGGHSLPGYWVAVLLVAWLSVGLHLFPATGYTPIGVSVSAWAWSITLPVLALSISGIASAAQQARGAMIDTLRKDYIRTLRSRGLSERSVLYKHALRNAAQPWLTILALQFIGLLGGAVVIERVFALPGLGTLAVDSTIQGDRPVVMGIVVFSSVMVVVVNLVVDVIQVILNPKVRVR